MHVVGFQVKLYHVAQIFSSRFQSDDLCNTTVFLKHEQVNLMTIFCIGHTSS